MPAKHSFAEECVPKYNFGTRASADYEKDEDMVYKNIHRKIGYLVFAIGFLWMSCLAAQSRMATCQIPLRGYASGGELILASTLNRNTGYTTIETVPNEPASSVVKRLAEAINKTKPFYWDTHKVNWGIITTTDAYLDALLGSSERYIFAGTERGLGIPRPPRSVTAKYDENNFRFVLRWRNAPGGYDHITVLLKWKNNILQETDFIPGDAEEWVLDFKEKWWYTDIDIAEMLSGLDMWIFGTTDDIPSNAAGIHVRKNIQEELFGLPFAEGTAPNWTAFIADNRKTADVAMGVREELTASDSNPYYNAINTRDSKPFYQIIRADPTGASGVMREFLGLSPGHTYRLSIRINTLETKDKVGDWSYSFHAAPTMSGNTLNHRQLAGVEALPEGQKGPDAARLVELGPQKTTRRKYNEFGADVTLPPGKDAITVWLRLMGDNPEVAVAMDYVSLEDLGKK